MMFSPKKKVFARKLWPTQVVWGHIWNRDLLRKFSSTAKKETCLEKENRTEVIELALAQMILFMSLRRLRSFLKQWQTANMSSVAKHRK